MTRHLQVRLEDDVYKRLEERARERGTSLTAIGFEAISRWLEGESEGPFGQITKQEEATLRGVLAYIRDKPYPPEREVWIKALEALAKRYPK